MNDINLALDKIGRFNSMFNSETMEGKKENLKKYTNNFKLKNKG